MAEKLGQPTRVIILEYPEVVVNTAGDKVTVEMREEMDFGEAVNCILANATPKAPEKPAEPTETQMRARHRDAVSRTMAAVDKWLAALSEDKFKIRLDLKAYSDSDDPERALSEYVKRFASYAVPEPLPQPIVAINSMRQVAITSAGFKGIVPLPPKVNDFLDFYLYNSPGLW